MIKNQHVGVWINDNGELYQPDRSNRSRFENNAPTNGTDPSGMAEEPYGKTIPVFKKGTVQQVRVPTLKEIEAMGNGGDFSPANFKGWFIYTHGKDAVMPGSDYEKFLKEGPALKPFYDPKTIEKMNADTKFLIETIRQDKEKELYDKQQITGSPQFQKSKDEAGPDITSWLAKDILAQIKHRASDIKKLTTEGTATGGPSVAEQDLWYFKYQAAHLMAEKWMPFPSPEGKGANTVVLADKVVVRKNIVGNIVFGVISTLQPPLIFTPTEAIKKGYEVPGVSLYGGPNPQEPHAHADKMGTFVGQKRIDNVAAFGVGGEIAARISQLESWKAEKVVSAVQIEKIIRDLVGDHGAMAKAVRLYESILPQGLRDTGIYTSDLTRIEYYGGFNSQLLTIPANNTRYDPANPTALELDARMRKLYAENPMGMPTYEKWREKVLENYSSGKSPLSVR